MKPTEILDLGQVSILVPAIPLHSREDGGHLSVEPHRAISDRSLATPLEAVQLMVATMLAGDALLNVIGVAKVNYQDMGNWSINKEGAKLHIHVFGRHKKQIYQIPGESISFLPQGHPIYTERYERFRSSEIESIERHINQLTSQPRFERLLGLTDPLS